MTVEVYKPEIDAGIADLVAKGSITVATRIESSDKVVSADEFASALAKFNLVVANANPNQLDLFYRHSVLASVGWNLNDDVFDKEDTWNARHTVADKQLNLHHNELNIVGHMTNSFVVASDGERLDDNLAFANVPDKFDVVSEFVLYRMWENEERKQEIEKIIAEIAEGKWFVSMECRFPKFDYAIVDKAGNHKVVARNAETAFLSKHLRAFGGTGEYQGFKVGRLLRGFFFTGQGIVENPANERSIIFDAANLTPFKSQGSLLIRDMQMDEKQIAELQSQLKTANATIETLKSEQVAQAAKQVEGVKAELDTTKTAKAAVEQKLAAAEATIASKDKAIEALTTDLAAANERVSVSEKEITALKADFVKKSRANKLAAAGVEADKVEAELAKWESLSDAQFDAVVAMFPPKKDDKKEDKKDKEKADATVLEADLEKTKAELNLNLNQNTNESNDRVAALSKHLQAGLPFSAKASKRFEKQN